MQYGQTVLVLRRLMAHVRDIMAATGSAQTRLARIAVIIAKDMAAEACCIYGRVGEDVLELFATHGLTATVVWQIRLQDGEGVIREIAIQGKPFALPDAQSHPSFAARSETGEENLHSLMGGARQRTGAESPRQTLARREAISVCL